MPNDRSATGHLAEAGCDRAQIVGAILDGMREGVVVIDTAKRVVVANRAAGQILGVREGHTLADIERSLGRPPEILPRALRGESIDDKEISLKTASRPEGFFLVGSGRPLHDDRGRLAGAVVVFRDVTARRKAEDDLRLRTEQLERSNVELRQFVSACSHDLQEPLRKIVSFGELLARKAGPGLDESSRHYLDRIVQAARRMSRLIEDLLQYSRISADIRDFELVDLGAAASSALSELGPRVAAAGAIVEIGPLPSVEAHPFQIKQIFHQLLSNALKFRPKAEPPKVRVSGAAREDGFAEFFVADNGIGFESRDAAVIFEPFRRLHPRDEYNGSGIGLAICRKIVTLHGGAISARSSPGEGATFTVTLPLRRKP